MDSSKFKKVESGNKKNIKKSTKKYNPNYNSTNKKYNKKSNNKDCYKKNNTHYYKKSNNNDQYKKNKNNHYHKKSSKKNYNKSGNDYIKSNNNYRNSNGIYKKQNRNNYNNSNNNYSNYNNYNYDDDIISFAKRDYYTKNEKKEKGTSKLAIFGIIILILLIIGVGWTSINMLNHMSYSSLPSEAVLVSPSEFDYKPDGYFFDNTLCGNFVGTNQNGTQTYFLTQNQIFALAYNSNNTFDYSEGIYVTYKREDSLYNGINVVKKMYFADGTEIKIPDGYDGSSFVNQSISIGSNSAYCLNTFGYSGEDHYKVT